MSEIKLINTMINFIFLNKKTFIIYLIILKPHRFVLPSKLRVPGLASDYSKMSYNLKCGYFKATFRLGSKYTNL